MAKAKKAAKQTRPAKTPATPTKEATHIEEIPPVNTKLLTPAYISEADGRAKRENSNEFLDLISPALLKFGSNGPVSCLTMPGPDWFWARELALKFPSLKFSIHGFETVREDYELAKANLESDPLPANVKAVLAQSSLRDAFKTKEVLYQVVIADYRVVWSEDRRADMDALFVNHRLASGGFLLLAYRTHEEYPISEWPQTVADLEERLMESPGFGVTVGVLPDLKADFPVSNPISKVKGIPLRLTEKALDYDAILQTLSHSSYNYISRSGITPLLQYYFRNISGMSD